MYTKRKEIKIRGRFDIVVLHVYTCSMRYKRSKLNWQGILNVVFFSIVAFFMVWFGRTLDENTARLNERKAIGIAID